MECITSTLEICQCIQMDAQIKARSVFKTAFTNKSFAQGWLVLFLPINMAQQSPILELHFQV